MPAAQKMQMEVIYRLSAVIPGVDDDAVASVQLMSAGELGGCGHQMSQQRRVFSQRLGLRGDVLLGDDKQMRRRLWVDIGKADAEVVLIHSTGGNGAGNDLTEETVRGHGSFSVPLLVPV
jgi:hypothetical protein